MRQFWPSPRHNIGLACGPSGLVVLDLDSAAHGALPEEWRLPGLRDGKDVLAQLCEWADQPWPCTYTVATPSGGWHLYFTRPPGVRLRNTAGKIGPLIDTRASGGYVLAAGSVVNGCPYEEIDGSAPIQLPGWLARLLGQGSADRAAPRGSANGRLAGLLRTVGTAPIGRRNDALYWAANRAREMADVGEISADGATVLLISAALAAGLPEAEARSTIASGMNGGDR